MDEKLWVVQSQNLYIMRKIWSEYSGRDIDAFYKIIKISNSDYSLFIRKREKASYANKKIAKRKEKILAAGFKYEWFTGEIPLCDAGFKITTQEWLQFVLAKRGNDIYKSVESKIVKNYREAISDQLSDRLREVLEVSKRIKKHDPKNVARQLKMYLDDIDVGSLSEKEIDELMLLSEQMQEFIEDIKAIKRYNEIMNRAK